MHPWAEFFGLRRDVAGTEAGRRKLCARVTGMIPLAARRGYQVERVLSRGAYGIVFVAQRGRRAGGAAAAATAAGAGAAPRHVALKLQFVCPKHVGRKERGRCGGYGQRASLYETVRYEARTHAELHEVARAAATAGDDAGPPPGLLERAAPVPRIPAPVAASRLLLGRRGDFPEVPPDGRRRLWVSMMEFVPHPSLRHAALEARDRGALTAGNFLALVGGVARHLAGMHARLGYAHGDAHSGNFLVDLDAAGRGGSWVYAIDLERAIPRAFVQLAPGLGTRAQRLQRWRQLRQWDLKIFCESAVALAETARVWNSPTPAGTDSAAATSTSTSTSPTDLPPMERLRRGATVAQAVADAYEHGWKVAREALLPASAAGRDEPPLATTQLLLSWVARALYLKHRPDGAVPEELHAAPGAPLRDADVRGVDRRAHRDFFALLRAAQSVSLARGGAARKKAGKQPSPPARRTPKARGAKKA